MGGSILRTLENVGKEEEVTFSPTFCANNAFCCKNYETAASDFDQKILKYYLDFEGAVYACVFQE